LLEINYKPVEEDGHKGGGGKKILRLVGLQALNFQIHEDKWKKILRLSDIYLLHRIRE
jgi:hypothetical protein